MSATRRPTVIWCCWLSGSLAGHPACKSWMVRYWHGYLCGARCKWFAYGPADATATPIISRSSEIQNGLPFWCRLTQVMLEKKLLNRCSSCNSSMSAPGSFKNRSNPFLGRTAYKATKSGLVTVFIWCRSIFLWVDVCLLLCYDTSVSVVPFSMLGWEQHCGMTCYYVE